MSRIVITGATGRLGANVVSYFHRQGHQIVACLLPGDRQEAKLDGLSVEKMHFDILDTDQVEKAIDGAGVVVHSAALMENMMDKLSPSQFFDINVKGTFNVLEGIRKNTKPTRLVCCSSTAAYDIFTCPREPLTEDMPRRPITLYGMNKILVEEQIAQYGYQYGIPYTILRPNYITSGDEILDIFTCDVVKNCLEQFGAIRQTQLYREDNPQCWMSAKSVLEKNLDSLCIPRCPGGESWRWHMTDVRDVVRLMACCLENDSSIGQTFNIAASNPCEWPDVVRAISKAMNREVIEVNIPNLWQFSLDQSASQRAIGFEPMYDHQAIVDTALAVRRGEDVGLIPGEIAELSYESVK